MPKNLNTTSVPTTDVPEDQSVEKLFSMLTEENKLIINRLIARLVTEQSSNRQ